MVQFKAHGSNSLHITGQLLVRPWLSDDADTSIRVTVAGATLPATPAASSKKRAAAEQKEEKPSKKQRRAEETAKKEQEQAAAKKKEEEAAAAAAVKQEKADKKAAAAAAKLQKQKKQQQQEEEEKRLKQAALKKEKEKAQASKPEPFIQSRKFTGKKKGAEEQARYCTAADTTARAAPALLPLAFACCAWCSALYLYSLEVWGGFLGSEDKPTTTINSLNQGVSLAGLALLNSAKRDGDVSTHTYPKSESDP